MRMRFLAPLLLFPVLAQAQVYRWVDDKGKVHYSDRAPVSGAKNVQKQSRPVAQGSAAALPYALQQAVSEADALSNAGIEPRLEGRDLSQPLTKSERETECSKGHFR